MPGKFFHLHLVSDATGATLHGIARACLSQFEGAHSREKFWNFVRGDDQMDEVIAGIEAAPGPVLFTLVSQDLRRRLDEACARVGVPCISILDPVLHGLSVHLGQPSKAKPGGQYELNAAYFSRIDAVDFALQHDDGQNLPTIGGADIVLVGPSRTSKTPTSFYLANRGIKAANIPLVPDIRVPVEAFTHAGPLYVGLTEAPERLIEVRRHRLEAGEALDPRLKRSDYLALDAVEDELREARRLFTAHGWPVIDVTRRSVEETAAEALTLLNRHRPDRKLL